MGRTRKGRNINGILLVDKPTGVSSNQVVQQIKRLFFAKKAGHTGALDPLATGLLPVCLGEATKFSQCLLDADKGYLVTAKLGERTDTSDSDGEIVSQRKVDVTQQDIKNVVTTFIGDLKQIPSMYSALKHQGKPLYWYARQGIEIERPARNISIYDIKWCGLENEFFTLEVKCSKGTYIRTLIDDIGEALGCGAHVTMLRRLSVAHFNERQMFTFSYLDGLKEKAQTELNTRDALASELNYEALDQLLLGMDAMVESYPSVFVSNTDSSLFQQGGHLVIPHSYGCGQQVKVYRESDNLFLGLAHITDLNYIQPKRVVVY